MAPEQLEGGEADSRSDIFAFGAAALRDGDGKEGVHGQEPGEPRRRDPPRRPDLRHRDRADDPARSQPHRQDVPRQGPGGPVPDGARRQAAAPVDRGRRLAGGPARAGRRAPQEPRAPRLGRRRGVARRGRRAGTRLRPRARRPNRAPSGSRSALRKGSSRSTPRESPPTGDTSRSTRRIPRARPGSGFAP